MSVFLTKAIQNQSYVAIPSSLRCLSIEYYINAIRTQEVIEGTIDSTHSDMYAVGGVIYKTTDHECAN